MNKNHPNFRVLWIERFGLMLLFAPHPAFWISLLSWMMKDVGPKCGHNFFFSTYKNPKCQNFQNKVLSTLWLPRLLTVLLHFNITLQHGGSLKKVNMRIKIQQIKQEQVCETFVSASELLKWIWLKVKQNRCKILGHI